MSVLVALALSSASAEARWLIIQEGASNDSHDVLDGALNGLGEPFDVLSGAAVAGFTADQLFIDYEVIFVGVGSVQPQVTDTDVRVLITNGGVVEQYVDLGGILFVHGAHNDPVETTGPGGSEFRSYQVSATTDDFPTVVDFDHEFIVGTYFGGMILNNAIFAGWGSTCHGAVDPPPGWATSGGVNLGTSPQDDQWNRLLFSPANNGSAMLEYTFGCGYVIMDMMTFDWAGSPLRDAVVAESAAYVQGIQGNFPFCNADGDADGLLDSDDNCPDDANPLQEDADGDGLGDVCDPCDDLVDPDSDGDGSCDSVDVCPGDDNADDDGDGIADGCDACPVDAAPNEDTDGDTVCNSDDVCPQGDDLLDGDLDGIPDGCDRCDGAPDIDTDGDGVCDFFDVCPGFDDDLDGDGDGVANGCDVCPVDNPDDTDGDTVCDADDRCPNFDDSIDADADGFPDQCDLCPLSPLNDSDGDLVCNDVDACPGFDDRDDADADGLADFCDNCPFDPVGADDDDSDGACNAADMCPGFDDIQDFDLDLVPDDCDNCPRNDNFPQYDDDDDGFGSQCDCNDDNASINADAVEVCDGDDNDCDGDVDEVGAIGPESWFADRDGDGAGDPDGVVEGCTKPEGVVGNDDDCNDENPLVNPDASEYCDTIDNNCDGTVDEGDVCVTAGPDAEPPPPSSCGDCSTPGRSPTVGWPLALLAAGLVVRRRALRPV